MDDLIAAVCKAARKPDVCRRMNEHAVTSGAKYSERRQDASQNTVFVADHFSRKACHTVLLFMPADDLFIVFISHFKISVGRMLDSFCDRFRNRRARGKVHVSNPHRDAVKSVLRGTRRKGRIPFTKGIHCDGILAISVHYTLKIIFHSATLR